MALPKMTRSKGDTSTPKKDHPTSKMDEARDKTNLKQTEDKVTKTPGGQRFSHTYNSLDTIPEGQHPTQGMDTNKGQPMKADTTVKDKVNVRLGEPIMLVNGKRVI